MTQYVIFADDLTGANDSAAQFAAAGLSTAVAVCPAAQAFAGEFDVIVCDTESRDIGPERASRAVLSAFDYVQSKLQPDTLIYKKVDSTLRGSIGAELEALLDKTGADLCLFAPAFPQNGRTTENGRQLLNGVPLELTELAHVPKSPVKTSDIAQILSADSTLVSSLINLNQIHAINNDHAAELEQLIASSLQAGSKVIIGDAADFADLKNLAAAFLHYAAQSGRRVVFAGSAGLARAISELKLSSNDAAAATIPSAAAVSSLHGGLNKYNSIEHPAGCLLFLSGSISKTTQEQCRVLSENADCAVISVNIHNSLSAPEIEAQRLQPEIMQAAKAHAAVLCVSTLTDADVENCRHACADLNLSFFEAGERIARTMAAVMKLCAPAFAGFVMTGGDTAVHACRAVGAEVFAVKGELESGIALCTVASGPYAGRALITKAGAFGRPDTFLNVFNYFCNFKQGNKRPMRKPVLGITMGDAAGIGSEITVKSLVKPELYDKCVPVVFGDAGQIKRAVKILNLEDKVQVHCIDHPSKAQPSAERIEVIDLHNVPADIPFGKVDARCGKAAYEFIAKAVSFAMDYSIHAVVTAPLNKEALHLGGCPYPGHTEILAALTGTKDYSMMLVSPKLRVIHVSTHIQLRKACDACTKERVLKVIHLADETLKLMGFEKPRIAVAGLNPHCGEGGLFGDEEIKEIIPACEAARAEGLDVSGPIAPDTVFHRAANKGEFDIVVVMYHDQGHIPLKVLGFSTGVNVTVGLPIIRTSVDHGTAFEIAGKGIADCESMDMALDLGAVMAATRFKDKLI